jgi:hypothetical protein
MIKCLQKLPEPHDGVERQVEKVLKSYVASCGQDYMAMWRQGGSTEELSMAAAMVDAYKAMGCRYSNPTQADMETMPQGSRSMSCSPQDRAVSVPPTRADIAATKSADPTTPAKTTIPAERGWLGVGVQEVTPENAKSLGLPKAEGALVADLVPGGPAEKIGIKQGDVIEAYGGRDIVQVDDLLPAIAETQVGQRVTVKLWRNGHELVLAPTIVAMPNNLETRPAVAPTAQAQARADQRPLTLADFPPVARLCQHPELDPRLDWARGAVAVAMCERDQGRQRDMLFRLMNSPSIMNSIPPARKYRCMQLAYAPYKLPFFYEEISDCLFGGR